MKKTLIITHGEDPDGIISGALLKRFLGRKLSYCFVTHSHSFDVFSRIANKEKEYLKERDLWVTDLNVNNNLIKGKEASPVNGLAGGADYLVWVDHHEGTKKYADYLQRLGIRVILGAEEKLCTAKLVYNEFLSDDDYAFWLSEVAQAHDYNKEGWGLKIGKRLQKIITFYNLESGEEALEDLVRRLAQKDKWYKRGELDGDLKEILKVYGVRRTKAIKNLEESREIILVGGERVMFAYGDSILPPKDAGRYLREKYRQEADIYAVIFGRPRNSVLIMGNNTFDVVGFCEYRGGGGREGDGGFILGYEVTKDNYQKAKDKVVESLEGFVQRSSA